jgi:hypothetical protein
MSIETTLYLSIVDFYSTINTNDTLNATQKEGGSTVAMSHVVSKTTQF